MKSRAWRVRKRDRHIDAFLRRTDAGGVELQLVYGERVMYRRVWPRRADAEADAARRLADLERAGWATHW